MSNRLLWILILIGFVWVWYIYYHMSYKPAQQEKQRQLIIEQERQVQQEKEKQIDLVEQPVLEEVIDKQEKIEQLKEKMKSYAYFELSNDSKAIFQENGNMLDLYIDETKIGSFDKVWNQNILVEYVPGSSKDVFIQIAESKYIYNHQANSLQTIMLKIPVVYVKKGAERSYIIVTDKWSFIYNQKTADIEYFSFFQDFIYKNDGYIWLVRNTDTRTLNNLWLDKNKNHYLVYYNPNTKERKIIFETQLSINSFYLDWEKLMIESSNGKIFELENI